MKSLHIPSLVAPDVGLNDDSFLFKETEVSPADEATNVPLDGDCRPCLGATPFFLHPLVQTLLHKHLCVITLKEIIREWDL